MDSQWGIGIPASDGARFLLAKIRSGNDYARSRKRTFRRSASVIKVASLALSAGSTVILGLQDLNLWASVAFTLVALVTLLGAVEPFFNWRSRWILMEEAQYRFQRLADELEYLMAATPEQELSYESLRPVFDQYQEVWASLSERWLENRANPEAAGRS
ncbi:MULTISPECIES: DUF4231 domain-containing protein [Streptomyces]|uniref:DUF4231 domain-containing protein n=1 Tax=Streptomyces TaxID=1883 RepID=UPI001E6407A0|nr:DUF4231 domain-containing protein [Streptomyces ruber]